MFGLRKSGQEARSLPNAAHDFKQNQIHSPKSMDQGLDYSCVNLYLLLTWSRGIVACDSKDRLRHSKRKVRLLIHQGLSPVILAARRRLVLDGQEDVDFGTALLLLPCGWTHTKKPEFTRVSSLLHVYVDPLKTKQFGAVLATIADMRRQLLCALPLDNKDGSRQSSARSSSFLGSSRLIDFSSGNDGAWEKFTLIPFGHQHVDPAVVEVVADLLPAPAPDPLFSNLNKAPERFRAMALLQNLRYPHLLTSLPDAQAGSTPRAAPHSKKHQVLSPSLDWIGELETPVTKPRTYKSLLKFTRRLSTKPEATACIVATARNEAVYLPHWCAYHWALGFDHIFFIPTIMMTLRWRWRIG